MKILAANSFVPGAPSIVPSRCLDGSCTRLADVEEVFVNIAGLVLGGIGIVLLGVVVYGGYLYLSSGGDKAKVTKATKVLTSAAFGFFIVFTSYAIVTYFVGGIAGEVPGVNSELIQPTPEVPGGGDPLP